MPLQRDLAAERAAAAAQAEAWRYGGGSIYATPVIDPARRLLIFGSGNPSPQMTDASRPGDNLYTSSLIALDLDSGRRVWHYQQVPHDRWGYDVASPPVLLEVKHGGRRVAAVAQASKLGWVYVHERRDRPAAFQLRAFVPQRNLFTPPQPGEGVVVAPGIAGGANWSPSAYDPERALFFVGALHLPTRYVAHRATRPDGSVLDYASTQNVDESWGTLSAIDMGTGAPSLAGSHRRAADRRRAGHRRRAGVLRRRARPPRRLRRRERERLWEARCEAGVNAPPVTYAVGTPVRRGGRRRQCAVRLSPGRRGDRLRAPGVTRGLSPAGRLARVAT